MGKKAGVTDVVRADLPWALGVRFRTVLIRTGKPMRVVLEEMIRAWTEKQEARYGITPSVE